MRNRVIIIFILVLIVGAVAYKLASNKKILDEQKQVPVAVNVAIPVATYTVERRTLDNNLIRTGKLIPFKEANITSTGNGKLISLNFDLGSFVNQNSTIAQIDSRLLELNLNAAELNYAKAEKDFERFGKLLEGEATTESAFQDIKLNYENSEIQIETIKKQISDNKIKAPISGQVISKNVENGEFVALGSVLGRIVDINKLKARVMVSEQDIYTLKIGNKVKVKTEVYPDAIFDGTINFISAQGDATHNYEVEVTINNSKEHPLKAGTFAYVDFNRASLEDLLIIPRSALVASLQNPYVYIVEEGIAKRKDITVVNDLGGYIEVSSGINEGDVVITSGQINITEGSQINALTSN